MLSRPRGALEVFPHAPVRCGAKITILYHGNAQTHLTDMIPIEIERVVQEVLVSCAVSEQEIFSTNSLDDLHYDLADPRYQSLRLT